MNFPYLPPSYPNEEDMDFDIPTKIGRYKVEKIVGRGGYAIVVKAIHEQTKEVRAIKILNREEISKSNTLAYVENELRLCSKINHPNIVKVYDIIFQEDLIMIIMEYLPNGDLQSPVEKGIKFTIERQIQVAYEILKALNYLHSRGISPRDVKPQNILFDECMTPKLIDFGLSKENPSHLHTYCGTPLYMAPEVIEGKEYDGRKSDIWTYGVTIHVLATFQFPWNVKNDAALIKSIQKHALELNIEPQGVIGELIRKTLIFDPAKRPTSEELLQFLETKRPVKPSSQSVNFDKRFVIEQFLPRLHLRQKQKFYVRERKIGIKPIDLIKHLY